MRQWIWSAQVGLALGVITFVLLFVPILMWQFRRFGRVSFMRVLGAAATSIYLTAVVSYTWLPLPERSPAWCAQFGIDTINTTPFAFLDDWRVLINEVGRRAALRNTVVLQVVFNFVLFVPWGIIARRYFGLPFIVSILSGFMASLFIEATQATGLWGIYDCAYRYEDIDDLIMNTAGTVAGAIAAPLVLFWMPKSRDLAATRSEPRPITSFRRYASMLITLGMVVGGTFVAIVVLRMGLLMIERPLDDDLAVRLESAIAVCIAVFFFYLPAIAGYGNVGMLVTWLAPRWEDSSGRLTKGPLVLRLMRASVVALPHIASTVVAWDLLTLLAWLTVGLSLAMVPFTRQKRALSGFSTGATLVDTRAERLQAL